MTYEEEDQSALEREVQGQQEQAAQARRDEIIQGRLPYEHADVVEQRELRIAHEDDLDAIGERAMDWADGRD